jgi:dienelactone hydrolase
MIAALAFAAAVHAQDMRFVYPAPPASSVAVLKGHAYGERQMDVYRPAGPPGPAPAIVFFNLATGEQRSNPFYKAWAEIAASNGIVAILPDLGFETFAKDYEALTIYLSSNAAILGIDKDRIALYAGSGNVYRALPLVQDPAQTLIKSAVMYYGAASVAEFRRDLPVLFVRAGLDRPPLNRSLDQLAALALEQNAPITVLNYPGGHHAFEIVDDEPATREVIDRTIAFVRQTTDPAFQASLQRGVREATAAAHVVRGNFQEAAASFAELVKMRPEDHRLRLSYGEALLGASRFAEACTELGKLKGKPLGARDLGVPAARACMQAGNADKAIEWLAGIPARYRPQELASDPVFAPIASRPDFQALFQPAGRRD